MKAIDWKSTAELVGIVAIVVSLVFAGLEIRQDHERARADLSTGTFDHHTGIDEALRDGYFALFYVRAPEDPDNLTLEETTRMNAFRDRVVSMWQRENNLRRLGVYRESDRMVEIAASLEKMRNPVGP